MGLSVVSLGTLLITLTGETQHNRSTQEIADTIYNAGFAAGVASVPAARVATVPTTSEITTSVSTTLRLGSLRLQTVATRTGITQDRLLTLMSAENAPANAANGLLHAMIGQRLTAAKWAEMFHAVNEAIDDRIQAGYNDGYSDGYADGYADGFADGVASTQ